MTAPHTVAGHTAGIDKAEEKNASLTMKLVAKSGYRSEVKVPAISPNQWGAIMAICEGKDACTRMLASADLLAALEWLHLGKGKPVDIAAAIAKATAARQSGEDA